MTNLEKIPLTAFRREGDETFDQEMKRIGVGPLTKVVGTQQINDEEGPQPKSYGAHQTPTPTSGSPPSEKIEKEPGKGDYIDIKV